MGDRRQEDRRQGDRREEKKVTTISLQTFIITVVIAILLIFISVAGIIIYMQDKYAGEGEIYNDMDIVENEDEYDYEIPVDEEDNDIIEEDIIEENIVENNTVVE